MFALELYRSHQAFLADAPSKATDSSLMVPPILVNSDLLRLTYSSTVGNGLFFTGTQSLNLNYHMVCNRSININ